MDIKFEFNPEKLQKGISELHKRQIPFASSLAINRLLFATQQNLRSGVDRWVHGGAVPFTKTGIQYEKSSKKNLAGFVFTADNRPYMKTMIYGGIRKPLKNNKNLIVPAYDKGYATTKLNKRGNIPRGTVKRLMSRSSKQFAGPRKKQPKTDYFVGRPKGQENRPRGLYSIKGKGAPKLVIAMQDKQKHYKTIWPANKIALKYAKMNFNPIFGKALSQAIASSIPRHVDSTGF